MPKHYYFNSCNYNINSRVHQIDFVKSILCVYCQQSPQINCNASCQMTHIHNLGESLRTQLCFEAIIGILLDFFPIQEQRLVIYLSFFLCLFTTLSIAGYLVSRLFYSPTTKRKAMFYSYESYECDYYKN